MLRPAPSGDEKECAQEHKKGEKGSLQSTSTPGCIRSTTDQEEWGYVVKEVVSGIKTLVQPQQQKYGAQPEQNSKNLGNHNRVQTYLHEQAQKRSPKEIGIPLYLLASVVDQTMTFDEIFGISEGDESIIADKLKVVGMHKKNGGCHCREDYGDVTLFHFATIQNSAMIHDVPWPG